MKDDVCGMRKMLEEGEEWVCTDNVMSWAIEDEPSLRAADFAGRLMYVKKRTRRGMPSFAVPCVQITSADIKGHVPGMPRLLSTISSLHLRCRPWLPPDGKEVVEEVEVCVVPRGMPSWLSQSRVPVDFAVGMGCVGGGAGGKKMQRGECAFSAAVFPLEIRAVPIADADTLARIPAGVLIQSLRPHRNAYQMAMPPQTRGPSVVDDFYEGIMRFIGLYCDDRTIVDPLMLICGRGIRRALPFDSMVAFAVCAPTIHYVLK